MLVLQVLSVLPGLLCLVAMSLYMLAACLGKSSVLFSLPLSETRFSIVQYILIVLAALGIIVCVFQGVEAMLFWVPSEWGFSNEDSNFTSYRTHFAIVYAAFAVGWVFWISNASYHQEMHDILLKEVDGQGRIINAIDDRLKLEALQEEFQRKITELTAKRTDSGRKPGRYEALGSGPYPPAHPEDEEKIMYWRLRDTAEAQLKRLSDFDGENMCPK